MDTPSAGRADTAPVEDLRARTPHGSLFVRVWGGREQCRVVPPIVLFHDSLGCVDLWRDFPAGLSAATGHPVVAYDRLGFGKSDPYPGPLPLSFVRDEADTGMPALRATLGIDTMILFGHSVGGAMAVVAASRPDLGALAVVTEGAQAFVEDRTLDSIRAARTAFAAPGEVARLARYHGDKAEWVLRAWTDSWLDPRFERLVLDSYLQRLACPVLAIHGDGDEYGSVAQPRRIAAHAASGAEVVIVGDCGHVPHREKPAEVLDAVSAFVTRLRGSF